MKSGFLNVHGKCNFRCRICMAKDFNSRRHFPEFASLKEQVLQAKRNKARELGIGGGEPTVYPRLFDLLDFAYQNKIMCVVGTNGFKLRNREYVKDFVKYRPIGFKISFHSHRKDVFDYITGIKGSAGAVLKAIDNINELLDVYPVYKRSYVLTNIVIHRYNYKDLPGIVKFLHLRGICAVNLSQLFLSGRVYAHPGLLVSLTKIQPYLEEAVAYLKENKLFYYIEKFPICILENEYRNFTPLRYLSSTYIKFKQCQGCGHNRNCCGISKIGLIAKYGSELIEHRELFGKDIFVNFFSPQDINFIKKCK